MNLHKKLYEHMRMIKLKIAYERLSNYVILAIWINSYELELYMFSNEKKRKPLYFLMK